MKETENKHYDNWLKGLIECLKNDGDIEAYTKLYEINNPLPQNDKGVIRIPKMEDGKHNR